MKPYFAACVAAQFKAYSLYTELGKIVDMDYGYLLIKWFCKLLILYHIPNDISFERLTAFLYDLHTCMITFFLKFTLQT